MSILSQIKELRETNGNISINKLEREAGLTRGSMAKWDSHPPSYEKLKKVADYFHVSVEYLLTGEEQKKPAGISTDGLDDMTRKAIQILNNADLETRRKMLSMLELMEEK